MISNISKALETTKHAMAPRENLLWILQCGAGSEGAMGFRAAWDAAIGLPMGLKGYGYRIPKGFYLSELWD